MSYSNKEIVEGLKAGEKEMLFHVFNQFNTLLIAFAKNTVKNPLLAEDFVQDAFCTLWESRTKLDASLPVQSFLYKLVQNRCVDFLRKQKAQSNYSKYSEIKQLELESTHSNFNNLIISEITVKEVQEQLRHTLHELPEQTREIFELSRYKEFTNPEIAAKIGLSVKSVEYHISKALQQLRKSMQDFL
jgi:RNA polymerase sigma-70 factor (ECF subfamily)